MIVTSPWYKYTLFFIFYICISCNTTDEKVLLSSTGLPGTIILVNYTNIVPQKIDTNFKNFFNDYQYGLPQAEKKFDITMVDAKNFSKTFKTFRNIFLVQKTDSAQPSLKIKRNVWAESQQVFYFNITREQDLINLIVHNKEKITTYINHKEREKIISRNLQFGNNALTDSIKSRFNIILNIQEGYEKVLLDSNFCWIRLDRERSIGGYSHPIIQALTLSVVPYTDTSQLSIQYLVQHRDSICKKYILGSIEGSYMETNTKFITPTQSRFFYQNYYVSEIRGLWRMKNGVNMGGPFIQVTFTDTTHNTLYIFDGYVFAPQFNKREYLREIEAIIYSFNVKS